MPQQGKTQKRSKKDSRKNLRYIADGRKRSNKVKKITAELKRLEKIRARNPDSKVDRSITDLKETRSRWERML